MRSFDFKSIRWLSRAAALGALCAWPSSALAHSAAPLVSVTRGTAATSTAATSPPPAAASAPCRGANLRPTPTDLAAIDSATACLIDRARGAAQLRTLHANPSLQRVAARQSREMVLGDYFGDDSRSGETPLQRIVATRYLRHAARVSTAQNIGWGTDTQATPAAIVAAWMNSPPHREIVLTEEFRDVGVGVSPAAPAALAAGRPGATYTVEFGTRR
jgi:uncharacterized protein YkwD